MSGSAAVDALPAPVAQGSSETEALVVFEALATKFSFNEQVAEYLVKTVGLRSIDDLRVAFTDLDKLQPTVIDQVKDLQFPIVQAARLRQAVEAIRQAEELNWDRMKRGVQETDDEIPLPSDVLKRMDAKFWARHKLKFAGDDDAGDTVVSKLRRALDRRNIKFENVMKVRTRKGEAAAAEMKRTRIDKSTTIVHSEVPEEHRKETVAVYLRALQTYLFGLARAGIEELDPKPLVAESVDTDSTDYVQVPLDLLMSYHLRACRLTADLQGAGFPDPIDTVQRIDEAERMLWSDRLRYSSESVGKVIKSVMLEREHVWVWHAPAVAAQPPPAPRCVLTLSDLASVFATRRLYATLIVSL